MLKYHCTANTVFCPTKPLERVDLCELSAEQTGIMSGLLIKSDSVTGVGEGGFGSAGATRNYRRSQQLISFNTGGRMFCTNPVR
jgi:hypothetical protein